MQGVFNASLLFLHFRLGCGTNVDHGNTASQLGQTLLELFAVIIGSGLVDLAADLLNTTLDVGCRAGTFDNRGVVLVNGHALGTAEIAQVEVFQLDTEVLGDAASTSENGNVLQHGLASVTESGSLDGADIQHATQLVDHQGGEGFTFDVLGNEEERLAALRDLLQQRQEVVQVADLLLMNQDVSVLENGLHRFLIGCEVRAEVALVELHAFHDIESGLDSLGFFNGDRAVLADLVHCVGNNGTDFRFPVGRDSGDVLYRLAVGDRNAHFTDGGYTCGNGLVDTALDVNRIGTGGDTLQALAENGLSQDGGGGGAITSDVAGLGCHFLHHLGTHVFKGILELNFLGDRDTILGDSRAAEFLVQDNVAALGAEGNLNSLGQCFDSLQERPAGRFIEFNLFSHDYLKLF